MSRQRAESLLVQQILLALGSRSDCRVWRQNTGGAKDQGGRFIRFGTPGAADIQGVLCPTGRFLALEAKAADGRLSEDQRRWGAMVTAMGGLYQVVRSVPEAVQAVDRASAAQQPSAQLPSAVPTP